MNSSIFLDFMKVVFPLRLYLHILQLEEYSLSRFLRWLTRNPLKRSVAEKKPLVWTEKATFLYRLSLALLLAYWLFLFSIRPQPVWFAVGVVLFLQPWFFLAIALLIRRPYEIVNRARIKRKTLAKVQRLKSEGLKVIAVTGSYGKTTTKEFLYHLLRQKYRSLRTPGSYNTLFGIEKVVNLELDDRYNFFICEMGAYKRGEIAELCSMVEPDYGILTGINEQHLERFGSIENTKKTKFELVDWVLGHGEKVVINMGNYHLKIEVDDRVLGEKVIGYNLKGLGLPVDQNWEGAATMAKVLGVSQKEIKAARKTLPPIPHRLQVTKRGDLTIIDDTYSSNPDGFRAALKFLSKQPGHKAVITSGIVELGQATDSIHFKLGQEAAETADEIVLVGKNLRTESLKRGLESAAFRGEIHFVSRVEEALGVLAKTKSAVVLFENDLPDQY